MPNGDAAAVVPIPRHQAGQPPVDGVVQPKPVLRHQLQDDHGRERLRGAADAQTSIPGDRPTRVQGADTAAGVPAALPDTQLREDTDGPRGTHCFGVPLKDGPRSLRPDGHCVGTR
jgi:hypothetical protein